MRKITIFSALLLILGMNSCSSGDDAQAVSPTNSDIMLKLAGSEWILTEGCPDHTFLTFNGFNECDYLNDITFSEQMAYLKPAGASYKIPHHICYVYGDKLVVSIQECSNTTWKPVFEWKVVSVGSSTLHMEMSAVELAPNYKFQFKYQKAG